MSVSAVIVNYYTATYLPDLLMELSVLDEMERLFVVDNSKELSHEQLCRTLSLEKQHTVDLISPEKNVGFGAGVNLAAKKAETDYLLIINPDVRLFPGCLGHLLDAARRYGALLTGPRFYWDAARRFRLPPSQGTSAWMDFGLAAAPTNRLEHAHLDFYWQIRHERFWRATTPFPELYLSGACLLVDRAWAMAGGSDLFDERFFLYFEDNDLSLRAAFDGALPLCVPAAEALHHYDQSPSPETTSKGELMGRSHTLFAKKFYGGLALPVMASSWDGPECHDLGVLTAPPVLNFEGTVEDASSFCKQNTLPSCKAAFQKRSSNEPPLYFEMGVTPLFVPFAQTEMHPLDILPEEIWDKMADGVYYGRIRDAVRGTLMCWRWEKVSRA